MADHKSPNEPTLTHAEPAALAEAARVLIVALVGAGLITIDSALLNSLAAGIGLLLSVALTAWTRSKVTPLAAPRDSSHRLLVPMPERPNIPPEAPPPTR